MRTCCIAQETLLNTLWQPIWEQNPNKKKSAYMYVYNWLTLLYTWN